MMTRDDLEHRITEIVSNYIDNAADLNDPQLRINPASLDIGVVTSHEMLAEIEDFNEVLESAAAVEGDADQEDTNNQVVQTPDFYSLRELTLHTPDGHMIPDTEAIGEIAAIYI